MKQIIRFNLNGSRREMNVEGNRAILWVLRADLSLAGCDCSAARANRR